MVTVIQEVAAATVAKAVVAREAIAEAIAAIVIVRGIHHKAVEAAMQATATVRLLTLGQ